MAAAVAIIWVEEAILVYLESIQSIAANGTIFSVSTVSWLQELSSSKSSSTFFNYYGFSAEISLVWSMVIFRLRVGLCFVYSSVGLMRNVGESLSEAGPYSYSSV